MRRVVWAEYMSVDGVVDAPSWTRAFWNDELSRMQKDQLFRSDALLLGRITYEAFAQAWPTMADPDGFADRMNSLPKHVASRTLKKFDWNAKPIEGDVADGVARLKQQSGGDLLIYGSASLSSALSSRTISSTNTASWFIPSSWGGADISFETSCRRRPQACRYEDVDVGRRRLVLRTVTLSRRRRL